MTSFALTFDYLCPFARNVNEHVVTALRDGAPWDVTFTPYSQSQGHVEHGDVDVWDRDEPDQVSGLLALQLGLAVRDNAPDAFLDAHVELFAARHDHGQDIRDAAVLREALGRVDVDVDEMFAIVADRGPLQTLRSEHERNVTEHHVWGVPTFIGQQRSVFVRLLDRPGDDPSVSRHHVDRVLEVLDGFPELHELKQTDLPV